MFCCNNISALDEYSITLHYNPECRRNGRARINVQKAGLRSKHLCGTPEARSQANHLKFLQKNFAKHRLAPPRSVDAAEVLVGRSPALWFRPIGKSLISCRRFFLHAARSWKLYCRALHVSYCRSASFCRELMPFPLVHSELTIIQPLNLQDIIVLLGAAKKSSSLHMNY